jgi:hypothetical protein
MLVSPVSCQRLPLPKSVFPILLLLSIFAGLSVGFHHVDERDLLGQLQRRQRTLFIPAPPSGCGSPCAFFQATINCNTNPCVCEVWASTSQAVVDSCAACISQSDQALANQYVAQPQMCINALQQLSITVSVTSPATEGTHPI